MGKISTPAPTLPPMMLLHWHRILNISKRDYPRAMQLAGEWGKRLAEHDINTLSPTV